MELIVLVVAVALVIGLTARVKRKRKRDSHEPADAPPPEPEKPQPASSAPVPTFKVVALGLSGSGKSVLLASMFHELDHRADGRSYYLDAPADQRVALNAAYRTLADTRRDWPRATRVSECTEYRFRCMSFDVDGRRHHLLDLSYLDYAGELLEHAQDAGRGSFQELIGHIDSAQALLGLLDGQRILQLLRGEQEGYDYIQFEMRSLFGLLQSAAVPIHLVISKWDLVRNFGEPVGADDNLRLDRVIDALMTFDHFRALVYSGQTHLVRLIPVSAVGSRFADLRADGVVVKRPAGQIQPVHVHVPLCAVVPDLFRQIERKLDESARREIDASLRRSITFRATDVLSGFAAFFNRPAGGILRAALIGAVGSELANEVGRMFVEWAARPYERLAGGVEDRRKVQEEEFGRFRTARAEVLAQFEYAVRGLEALMPNSRLGRP